MAINNNNIPNNNLNTQNMRSSTQGNRLDNLKNARQNANVSTSANSIRQGMSSNSTYAQNSQMQKQNNMTMQRQNPVQNVAKSNNVQQKDKKEKVDKKEKKNKKVEKEQKQNQLIKNNNLTNSPKQKAEKGEKGEKGSKEHKSMPKGLFTFFIIIMIAIFLGGIAIGALALYRFFDVEPPITTTKISFEQTLTNNLQISSYEFLDDTQSPDGTLVDINTLTYDWNNGQMVTFKFNVKLNNINNYLRFRTYTLYNNNETEGLLKVSVYGLPSKYSTINEDGYYYFHNDMAEPGSTLTYELPIYIEIKFNFDNYSMQYAKEEFKQMFVFESVENPNDWVNYSFGYNQPFDTVE